MTATLVVDASEIGIHMAEYDLASGGPIPWDIDFTNDLDDPNRHASLCDCAICEPLPEEDDICTAMYDDERCLKDSNHEDHDPTHVSEHANWVDGEDNA
jgi:hypothetical protein